MSAPRVTIAIPCYRTKREHLLDAVGAALAQTYADREILIADDGTDPAVLDEAAALGPIRVVRNERRLGMAGNWNRCVELARGEYVHIAHSDDVPRPRHIERTVGLLEGAPKAGFAHPGWSRMDDSGAPLPPDVPRNLDPHDRDFVRDRRDHFASMIEDRTWICAPTVVCRRSAILAAGPFDPSYVFAVDLDMWLRLAFAFDAAYAAEDLLRYRVHGSSTTGTTRAGVGNHQLIRAKSAVLARAAGARAFPEETLAEWRRSVARGSVRYARRHAVESPEFVLAYLRLARALDPRSLLSAGALTALLRAPVGLALRALGIRARPRTRSKLTASAAAPPPSPGTPPGSRSPDRSGAPSP